MRMDRADWGSGNAKTYKITFSGRRMVLLIRHWLIMIRRWYRLRVGLMKKMISQVVSLMARTSSPANGTIPIPGYVFSVISSLIQNNRACGTFLGGLITMTELLVENSKCWKHQSSTKSWLLVRGYVIANNVSFRYQCSSYSLIFTLSKS